MKKSQGGTGPSRIFYRRYKKVQPVISVYVESRKKREAIRNLNETTRTKEKYYYDIVPFGNGGIYQSQQGSEALLIEYLGLGIHAHYCRLKKEDTRETRREVIKGYYSRQYNRRSSIAGGMHISSKLWEMGLGIIRVPENECEKKLFQKFVHPVNYEERTENIRKPVIVWSMIAGWRMSGQRAGVLQQKVAKYR